MYTGKHIELDDLFDKNLYDIDHIYPMRIRIARFVNRL